MEEMQVAETSTPNHVFTPVKWTYSVYDPPRKNGESSLPPVIFIHGAFCSKVMHEHIVKDLSEKTGRKVYSVDMPCHGTSPFRSDLSVFSCKMDLEQFIEDRNIKTKIIIISHSAGCIASHAFAADHPERIEKIVMIDHLPDSVIENKIGLPYAYEQVRYQNKLLQLLNPKLTISQAKKSLLRLAEKSKTETQKAFIKKAAHELTKKSGRFQWTLDLNFILNLASTFTYTQTKPYYGDILLIRALDSPITTDETVANAQKLNPKMKVIVYENGGHMLFLEHSERFVKDVTTYLKE